MCWEGLAGTYVCFKLNKTVSNLLKHNQLYYCAGPDTPESFWNWSLTHVWSQRVLKVIKHVTTLSLTSFFVCLFFWHPSNLITVPGSGIEMSLLIRNNWRAHIVWVIKYDIKCAFYYFYFFVSYSLFESLFLWNQSVAPKKKRIFFKRVWGYCTLLTKN